MKKLVEGNTYQTNTPLWKLNSGANLISPFGPPIYQCEVSQELIDELKKYGDNLTVDKNDYRDQLAGNMKRGCSYDYELKEKKYFGKKLSPYISDLLQSIESIKGQDFVKKFLRPPVKYKEDVFKENAKQLNLTLDSLWINYQKSGDFNPPHTHWGVLSFVIFCQVPERIFDKSYVVSNSNKPGEICFTWGEDNLCGELGGSGYYVKPYERLMFVFPANLKHHVAPFWTDDIRISVSGNYVWSLDDK